MIINKSIIFINIIPNAKLDIYENKKEIGNLDARFFVILQMYRHHHHYKSSVVVALHLQLRADNRLVRIKNETPYLLKLTQ